MTVPVMRPRWQYNDGSSVDFQMSLPQRPWDFGFRPIGGSDVSGAGVPESFEIRQEHLLHLTLRFTEAEWSSVRRLVHHLQGSGTADLSPDRDDGSGATHTVYGDSPAMGEEVRPTRGEDPGTLELEITVRRTTESVFTDEYF